MCLRLLVLGLHDQATAFLIEIVFAIVCCVRVCISLIAQWLGQFPLVLSAGSFFGPHTPASLKARKNPGMRNKKIKTTPLQDVLVAATMSCK